MPYLTVLDGQTAGDQVALTGEILFIGRDSNNHLVIPDRIISRKHAVIDFNDGRYILNDLKSTKGTWVRGEKIHECVLRDGDEFSLGNIRVKFSEKKSVFEKKKSRWAWIVTGLFCLLFVVAAFAFLNQKREFRSEVESYYNQGVTYWNIDRDSEKAKESWKKVLALDPKRKSPYAQKASKLLKMLENTE